MGSEVMRNEKEGRRAGVRMMLLLLPHGKDNGRIYQRQ